MTFVDLRRDPERLQDIREAVQYPALRAALLLLNGAESQLFTSKCDAWLVPADDLDACELDVSPGGARIGIAAYIDVVLREAADFSSFAVHESWLRQLTADLRTLYLPAARVDFTLRWAEVEDNEGFGVTAHITACGVDEASAMRVWHAALAATIPLLARS